MKKTPRWFYIFLVFIPILFLVILELALRAFSYGKNLEQWIEIADTKLVLNPEIGARYFTSTANFPQSNNDAFDKVKKENSIRIFIVGGSSAAGFPFSPNGTFSRYIKDRLDLIYPDKNVEVVNLGITAVNTYTIADLLPGIIEQKPDLLIIYAGHNEYYGALGVGSLESVGNSAFLINTYLYLNNFKTFQLVKDFIKWSAGLLPKKNESYAGTTLMARMAQEKLIEYKSDLYNEGLEQFKNNLEYILSYTSKNKVKALIGTLACNLKDIKPFVSVSSSKYPSAEKVFSEAQIELLHGNILKSDSLFRFARDLDGLRFRAPGSFNKIIDSLAKKYNSYIADIEDGFNNASQIGIVGDNLMVDHLHPTLEGYLLMGKIFTDKIIDTDIFNYVSAKELSLKSQDSTVTKNFAFSKLDSTIAHFRILNLLNDWPFVQKKDLSLLRKLNLQNRIDSLAFKVVKEDFNWEIAHQEAYKWYLLNNDTDNFSEELKVLSSQFPFKLTYANYAAQELIKLKAYDNALYFLERKFKYEPDEFSAKWIGNIKLFQGNYIKAVLYLSKSLTFNNRDAQTYFNLAIAHYKMNEYDEALASINNCTLINSSYPNAQSLKNQLESLIKKPQ